MLEIKIKVEEMKTMESGDIIKIIAPDKVSTFGVQSYGIFVFQHRIRPQIGIEYARESLDFELLCKCEPQ